MNKALYTATHTLYWATLSNNHHTLYKILYLLFLFAPTNRCSWRRLQRSAEDDSVEEGRHDSCVPSGQGEGRAGGLPRRAQEQGERCEEELFQRQSRPD